MEGCRGDGLRVLEGVGPSGLFRRNARAPPHAALLGVGVRF
jgi:hypothetical protein